MTEIQLLNKPTPVEKYGGITLKIVILWIMGIIASFIFGWFLMNFMGSNDSGAFVFAAIFGIIFLAIFLLQAFFVPENGPSAFSLFLESIAMVLPFIAKSPVIISFSVVIFMVLYAGNSAGRTALENNLKINFWNTSKAVLPKGIAAVSLLIAGLIPAYMALSARQFPISPSIFREVVFSGSFLPGKIVPGFSPSATIENIARNTAVQKLSQVPNVRLLPDAARQQIINDSVSGFYQALSSYVGSAINPKLTISDLLYEIAKEKFLKLSETLKYAIYAVIGILAFFTIEAVSWPLRMVVSMFAFIVMEIMLALGFAQIVFEQRSKEIIIT